MIHLYGDSITAGSPGASYCDYFPTDLPYKKYGVGGDTVSGLLNRLKKVEIVRDDLYLIEIGTNDLLLPHLSTLSPSWKTTVLRIEESGRVATRTPEQFQQKYEEVAIRLGGTQTLMITIPCIGEEVTSEVNARVEHYNAIIKAVCLKHGHKLIDFHAQQKSVISQKTMGRINNYFIGRHAVAMIWDVVLTNSFGLTDFLSRRRGLLTTMDGVHLNSAGAMLLAKMVIEGLREVG